jgi:hypothetical protein
MRLCALIDAVLVAGLTVSALACGFSPDGSGPDASGNGDADSDGVRDADDNCPMIANTDQHDEDSDAVGDRCDNCPHVANADQANTGEASAGVTADGAGDACDPFPSAPGNDIIFFESFAAPLSGWQTNGPGLWEVSGDAVTQSRPNVVTTLYTGSPQPGVVVDTVATPLSGNLTTGFGFGPVALYTPSAGFGLGYGCDLYDLQDIPFQAHIDYLESQGYTTIASDDDADVPLIDQSWRIRVMASTDRNLQTCQVTGSGSGAVSIQSADTRMLPGRFALQAFSAVVKFEHVVVFSVAN